MQSLKNFLAKAPPFLWVVLIAVAIVLINLYVPPAYAAALVTILLGAAKAIGVNTSGAETLAGDIQALPRGAAPKPRSKFMRWLVG